MARAPWTSSLLMIAFFMIHLCLVGPGESYVVKGESSYHMRREKVTHLHFFFHDTITGRNPTAVKVAQANGTASPIPFGDVYVIDDPLTEGVDPSSKVIGNAQGAYAVTGKQEFSLFLAADFGFTTGKYNGSSISLVSRDPIMERSREMAVVGGRGQFRLARGFALLTTRFVQGLNAIVECNVTVLHY